MGKKKSIIELKASAINLVVKTAEDCQEDFCKWTQGVLSDKMFAVLFIRRIDQLRDVCKTLKSRAQRFGEVDEKILAKKFHRIYEELAPKYKYETKKASRVDWDKLDKKHQELMVVTARRVLKEIFSG